MCEYYVNVWKSSYYSVGTRQWQTGQLMVSSSQLVFVEIPTNSADIKQSVPSIRIQYSELTQVKKVKSTFIYKAILVSCGPQQHWFASFTNRDSVYNVIEHFWREALLEHKDITEKEGTSRLGKELLEIAEDSQRTLEEAGRTLKHQGEQLNYALTTTYDMHNDLSVAERITADLESWLGRWQLPAKQNLTPCDPLVWVRSEELPTIEEFPVVYAKPAKPELTVYQQGVLHISRKGVEITDVIGHIVHFYHPKEVSEILVLSPWQIQISHQKIGEAEVTYVIESRQMVGVVTALQSGYDRVIQYSEPPPELSLITCFPQRAYDLPSPEGAAAIAYLKSGRDDLPELVTDYTADQSEHPHSYHPETYIESMPCVSGGSQVEMSVEQSAVTEQEAEQLCDMVGRMKAMALDVGEEQEKQNSTIDTLSSVVERATCRLKGVSRRLNKLL